MRCGLMEAQGDRTGAGTRWGSRVCCGRVSPQWRQYCCTRSSPFGDLRPTGYRPVLFCMFPESVKSSHYSASLHGGLVRPAQNAGLGARGRARQFRLGDEPLACPLCQRTGQLSALLGQHLADSLHLRADSAQLFFNPLVAAIDVIDAIDNRLAIGNQRSKD